MGDGRPKTRDIRVGFALLRRRGLVRPGKIIGVGRNYVDHAAELGNAVPERPLLFFKPPTAVIGDGDPIVLPPESAQVDFEAEIGVVIGTRLRSGGEAAQARAPQRARHAGGRGAAPAGRRGRSRNPRRGDPPDPGGLGRRGSLPAAQEHSLDPAPSALRLASRTDDLGTEAAYLVLEAAQRLEAAGRHVVHLEIGEPDTPTPPHIVEAGVRALRDGHTRYAVAPGIPELRAAIAESLAQRGLAVGPEHVVVTAGAKPALFYAMFALIEPGDEVLCPDPGFPIYESVVRLAGGRPVLYPLDGERAFAPDVPAIAERITPRTGMLVLNLPHNPTGGVAAPADEERLAELAQGHDLAVLSDEVYGQIRYEGTPRSIAALPGMAERTGGVDAFSKTDAMTGWPLGD